jgi:DNA-binding CsgD family transcriptional regulator
MRVSPVAVVPEIVSTSPPACMDDAIRILVESIEFLNKQRPDEAVSDALAPTDDVLLDTEVDGCRYLLVRMPKPTQKRVQLSPREQEIVRMVAKGHPNKAIADVLNISSWTVCTQLRRIFAKLGVGSRAAMVAQLLEASAARPNFGRSPQMR